MATETHFAFFRGVYRALTGRRARQTYLVILIVLLLTTLGIRFRSYLLVRRIQAVMRGLAEIRLDQTSESQLTTLIPNLTRKEWDVKGIHYRWYYAEVSNESDRLPLLISNVLSGQTGLLVSHLKNWLGYRYIRFDAAMLVQGGRVTHVSYGLANQWVRPLSPAYIGYFVSARSVHGFWRERWYPFRVSSQQDEGPSYNPSGGKEGLFAIYTSDAPPNITRRVFKLNLDCFWYLHGCDDAREVAPDLWSDAQTIRHDAYQQLISEKCSESIVKGRLSYLPDVIVLLLEVTGSRRVEVNEEGEKTEDWFTDYKLKEVLRGSSFPLPTGSWKNIRFSRTIPSLDDPSRTMANQIWPETKIGTEVLYFQYPKFDSCRFIPATPSLLEIVRRTPISSKRLEDVIPSSLM